MKFNPFWFNCPVSLHSTPVTRSVGDARITVEI
jgi:hypothetical protein